MSRVAISRRSFLERLGLGAGAVLLSPIAQRLVGEARGATGVRKRFVVWMGHQGIRPACITPPGVGEPTDRDMVRPILDGPKGYTWPAMVKALEPYRDRMLLLDGFNNNLPKLQHSAHYAALSCVSALDNQNEYAGPPGGVTIDQYVAAKLGADTKFKTVLWGAGGGGKGNFGDGQFSSGPNRREPHHRAPGLMFRALFGDIMPTTMMGPDRAAVGRRLLFDGLRADIKKLETQLAGPEKDKLGHYLAAIEEFEKRQGNNTSLLLSCKAPQAPSFIDPPADQGTVALEDWITVMNEMSVLALVCGLTNVVGTAVNNGNVHGNWRYEKLGREHGIAKLEGAGHEPDSQQVPQMNIIHNFHAGQVKRFADALSTIKEGNGTAMDNSVIVYTTDNGDHHHSDCWRWPVVVLGNAGGRLRSDGRYLRYPSRARALADFWATISESLDVASANFGKPNLLPLKGPLTEVLV